MVRRSNSNKPKAKADATGLAAVPAIPAVITSTTPTAATNFSCVTNDSVATMSYSDLIARKEEIQSRLSVISIEPMKTKKPTTFQSTTTNKNNNNNTNASGSNGSTGQTKRKRRSAAAAAAAANPQATFTTDEEQQQQEEEASLLESNQVPVIEKTSDVHWDFTMKEMMWLATDFQAERKRQISLARKLAHAVAQYHKTLDSKRQRALVEAESKRRKKAAKIGRDVKSWWTKLERVIAYKQKCSADEERRQAMNKQLVTLVKQTEQYTQSLMTRHGIDDDDDDDDTMDMDSDDTDDTNYKQQSDKNNNQRRRKRRRRQRRSTMTIEEALAMGERTRRSKQKVIDYNRLQLSKDDDVLYGESTASDTAGSDDASFSLDEDSDAGDDDETTMLEAEEIESKERHLSSFVADPQELQILQEESLLPIEQVLERYRRAVEEESSTGDSNDNDDETARDNGTTDEASSNNNRRSSRRNVSFASDPAAVLESTSPTDDTQNSPTVLPKRRSNAAAAAAAAARYDADDDADASDVDDLINQRHDTGGRLQTNVDDFVDLMGARSHGHDDSDDDGNGSDEYEVDQQERDDETTMEQEECLPQQMSAQEEIELLQREQKMSVDEIRQMYAGAFEQGSNNAAITTTNGNQNAQGALALTTMRSAAVAASSIDIDDDDDNDVDVTSNEDSVQDDGSEEFEADQEEVDDETTMEQEERLPQQMTAQEEIKLLKAENKMSVEQLRQQYAAIFGTSTYAKAPSEELHNTAALNGDNESDDSDVAPSESDDDTRFANGGALTKSSLANALLAGADNEDDGDEGVFEPQAGDDVDDETTLEAEERLGRDMSYSDELAMLKRENEMSVNELRAKYAGAFANGDSSTTGASDDNVKNGKKSAFAVLASSKLVDETASDVGDDAEFVAHSEEMDDETTMEAEERLGREMSPEKELAMLQKESEIPIEQLLEIYHKMEAVGTSDNAMHIASDDDDDDGGDDDDNDDNEGATKRRRESSPENGNGKRLKAGEESDEGLAAINALEESAERARRTLASRPFLIAPWVKLREYQQIGLNWLVSMQTRRLNGILADEMGLGKTLQTIALLAYLAAYKGIWGPHLVIVPTSVIVNWETELKRFAPGLKALCYYGTAKRRKELRTGWTKTNWYNVVVTSYQLAVQDAFAFKRKRWYYLILDEAQNIKNFQSQRWQTLINFNTQRRLLLTGTPLQNNLMELWSLLHFLMPYIFRSRKEFSFWFSNPMNSMIEGTSNQNDVMISRLHGIIRPFLLRRLKKDVETQLPGKFEHIVKCPLSRRQMFFYEEFMARSSTRQALKKGGNYMGMMNVLMQLRKVCNHPDLFEPRSVVTPFALNRIDIPFPDQAVGIAVMKNALAHVSQHLLSPLWSGSCATSSIVSALEHDEVRSMSLRELEDRKLSLAERAETSEDETSADLDIPSALIKLLDDLKKQSMDDRKDTVQFQHKINSLRCSAPSFPFSTRRLKLLTIKQHPIYQSEEDFLSTPSRLLAMRKSRHDRAEDVDEMIKKFVFCVPKAGAARPALVTRKADSQSKRLDDMLLEPLEECLRPFRKAHARLTSFFPDKKLVQFDAGKLQTLSDLLHDLKRGGHRVLIFTQMSKMLDILEAFLNLNGHTYVRLDGSTGVDRRQHLMDRFNNDNKIFSFILSTRSGGMGINLTGADTVIFYDSDWNPAMDAQAQDRAHRIGQTREVHIYRLITEHSIEENILVKAQQKRNLDILVMDKGKFDGAGLNSERITTEDDFEQQSSSDVFSKGGLRAILGMHDEPHEITEEARYGPGVAENENEPTREEMVAAMATVEDQDDVLALRGAEKEAKEELQEFDESIELKVDSDNDVDDEAGKKGTTAAKSSAQKENEQLNAKNEEEEMAKEFAAWQNNVGLDTSALEASLSPTEKYGLHFRQEIDPYWSMFAILEERRRLEAAEETKHEIDIDQIERGKAMDERQAIEDGDLLGTRPRPEDLVRQRNLYLREKARLKADKKRRKLTGENWELREDARDQRPFYYNTDTGEALWDKPTVLLDLEAENYAREKMWSGLPHKPLIHIMSYLLPYPERITCAKMCRQWRQAATDIIFVRHVYPVEMGAMAQNDNRLGHNHYRSIADALAVALPGDTIELGDGHYWVKEPGLSVEKPLRLVGDENNASNVVIEMSGTIKWSGRAGWVEGVTFRRPKISSGEGSTDDMLRILSGGRVDMIHSVVDNTGSSGDSTIAIQGPNAAGKWQNVIISGGAKQGVKLEACARVEMRNCIVRGNKGNGIVCSHSEIQVLNTKITENGGCGATLTGGAAKFQKCHFARNRGGILKKEDSCKTNFNHNTAPPSALTKPIAGFQATGVKEKR